MGGIGAIVRGEALVAELDEDGPLFALLRGPKIGLEEDKTFPAYVLFHAFKSQLDIKASALDQLRQLKRTKPKTEISADLVPMIVRFRNLGEPKSVEQVDLSASKAKVGSNVTLSRATIEITDDPITTGIERRLPWLVGMMTYLDGAPVGSSRVLANVLTSLSFKREK